MATITTANINEANITATTTLFKVLDILSPVVKPAKRPTPLWLRKNAKEIAAHTQKADNCRSDSAKTDHLTMTATLYDNGYGIYASGGHTSVVWLGDCLDIVYRFGFSTSGEREADETRIDRDVLGNMSWFQALTLRGEAQITKVLEGKLHGSADSEESENPEKGSENPEIAEENQCESPAEKIAGATHIAGPEDRFIRQETFEEAKKILKMLPASAAEVYILYHWYGMTQQEIADKLGTSQQVVSWRITKAQKALKEIVKQMRELLAIDVKAEI